MSRFLRLSAFSAGFLKIAMSVTPGPRLPRERRLRPLFSKRARTRSGSSRLSGHRRSKAHATFARPHFFVNETLHVSFPCVRRDRTRFEWWYSEFALASDSFGSTYSNAIIPQATPLD